MGLFDMFRKNNKLKNNKDLLIVEDNVFGSLQWDDNNYFIGKVKINIFNSNNLVNIFINTKEKKIDDIQYKTFEFFKNNLEFIQNDILDKLIKYYNDIKFSYGPEDDDEMKTWWPDINSNEDMILKIHIEKIVIQESYLHHNERCIYVLFNRDWGGPDMDDNGVAVEIINEEVKNIGYKDIAY